jgi:chorismate-pyruvate lyase
MKSGHPTRSSQIQTQRKLREYFECGITATLAAQKTDVNIKTAYKYFDEWAQEISEQETLDFMQRQRLDRERIILSYDKQILEAIDTLDELNRQIQKFKKGDKPIPGFLFSHKLELQKFIVSTLDKKGAISAQMPLDDTIKQKISELIEDAKSKKGN